MDQADTQTPDLLALLPCGIVIASRDYRIRYANPAAEYFLGESMAVLQGKELSGFIYPAGRLIKLIDAAFAGRPLIKEYDVPLNVPRSGLHMVNLQVLALENGDEAMIVLDDRGISPHMPAPESMRSASAMASVLAHEVKNPLSGIRGAAQLLDKTVSPEDRSLTKLIVEEADRIKSVIEEMEIFSNPSDLKTEGVNLHEALQHVRMLASQGSAREVRFKEIYDPSLPLACGNRNLLIQLFLNLITNAAEALQEHGDPQIALSTHYQGGMRSQAGGMQGRSLPLVVMIEDNGPGVPTNLRESIFNPFVTSKKGGKGLGLAVVAKIIADHGGAVALENAAGGGTRFKIFLPAMP